MQIQLLEPFDYVIAKFALLRCEFTGYWVSEWCFWRIADFYEQGVLGRTNINIYRDLNRILKMKMTDLFF